MHASQMIYTALKERFCERVYPFVVPETADDTPPYVVYTQIATEPILTLDGITHHEQVLMQIDVYHDDYDELLGLSAAVIELLNTHASRYQSVIYSTDGTLYRAMIEYYFNHTNEPTR